MKAASGVPRRFAPIRHPNNPTGAQAFKSPFPAAATLRSTISSRGRPGSIGGTRKGGVGLVGGHGSKLKAGLAILSVASAVLYLLRSYTVRKVHQIEAEVPAIGEFVTVDGLPQHFVSKGVGKPVVLIHGSDGTLRDYTISILDRVAQEYHALAFDRPGHGYSARPENEPLTVDTNARIIRESLRELGIERPLIVGHSYGGSVALAYALGYPDDLSGTVLIARPVHIPATGARRRSSTCQRCPSWGLCSRTRC